MSSLNIHVYSWLSLSVTGKADSTTFWTLHAGFSWPPGGHLSVPIVSVYCHFPGEPWNVDIHVIINILNSDQSWNSIATPTPKRDLSYWLAYLVYYVGECTGQSLTCDLCMCEVWNVWQKDCGMSSSQDKTEDKWICLLSFWSCMFGVDDNCHASSSDLETKLWLWRLLELASL